MPFSSKLQQRYLHAHPDKVGGEEKLKEWDASTNFEDLPEKAPKTFSDRMRKYHQSGSAK